MMSKKTIVDWLRTVPDDADIAIDEGGLTLVVVNDEGWLEVGGMPDEDEDEDEPESEVFEGRCPDCGSWEAAEGKERWYRPCRNIYCIQNCEQCEALSSVG